MMHMIVHGNMEISTKIMVVLSILNQRIGEPYGELVPRTPATPAPPGIVYGTCWKSIGQISLWLGVHGLGVDAELLRIADKNNTTPPKKHTLKLKAHELATRTSNLSTPFIESS